MSGCCPGKEGADGWTGFNEFDHVFCLLLQIFLIFYLSINEIKGRNYFCSAHAHYTRGDHFSGRVEQCLLHKIAGKVCGWVNRTGPSRSKKEWLDTEKEEKMTGRMRQHY